MIKRKPILAKLISLVSLIGSCCLGQEQEQMKPINLVTFVSSDASPLDAVIATALQTHAPVGIALGERQKILCESKHHFEIKGETQRDSLVDALRGTGYSLREEQGVLVVVPPDLTPFQQELLSHHFDAFSAAGRTMAGLGAQLTGSLWLEAGLAEGVGGSTLFSLSAKKYTLTTPASSTEEIANMIVSLKPKGVWVFKMVHASGSVKPMPVIQIWSYVDDQESIQKISCDQ